MFCITYFYNVRFLPYSVLPVSTAAWDPKWFHNFKDPYEVFYDKRGIINGLRIDALSCANIYNADSDCENCNHDHPESCDFLRNYYNMLTNVDFNKMLDFFDKLKEAARMPDADICLLVYEKPDNPCSERVPLIKWFKDNGYDLIEWTPLCGI